MDKIKLKDALLRIYSDAVGVNAYLENLNSDFTNGQDCMERAAFAGGALELSRRIMLAASYYGESKGEEQLPNIKVANAWDDLGL